MKTSYHNLRNLVLLSSTAMTLSLSACGGGSDSAPSASTAQATSTEAASAVSTAATASATGTAEAAEATVLKGKTHRTKPDRTTPTTTTPTTTPTTTTPTTTTPTTTTPTTTTPTTTTPTTTAAWHPAVTDTWQWQLTGKLNTSYAVVSYDIDLFDTTAATIQTLKSAGKKVICYFSAGSSENWRSDFASFKAADMGNALDGWAGERWLDTRSSNVRTIMQARLDLAKSKGCDGVEPDNVDGYSNSTGFALTSATQIDYNRFLATEGHARGLAVALKNDVDQLAALVGDFDLAINEQCHEYSECGGYSVFIASGKPVFNAEYKKAYKTAGTARDALCADAKKLGLRTLVLPLDLDDSFRYSCDQ